jgi:hypothetical protein
MDYPAPVPRLGLVRDVCASRLIHDRVNGALGVSLVDIGLAGSERLKVSGRLDLEVEGLLGVIAVLEV